MQFLRISALLIGIAAMSHAEDLSSQVFVELNNARTAPQQFAQLVASRMANTSCKEGRRVVEETLRFLQQVKPLPPLGYSEGLSNAALAHIMEQGPKGTLGHGNPWRRMNQFGQWGGYAGENIAYGNRDAQGIVVALIVDDGVPRRKHRANIFSPKYAVAGIASGPHARFGSMCVMDFAGSFAERGVGRTAGL
jgi:uncharacterized protein YkwD